MSRARDQGIASLGAVAMAEWVWYGRGVLPTICRLGLTPLALVFGAIVARRTARFDRGDGVLPTALPSVSIGNLTVGGTGKTPFAAWCVGALRHAGGHPAVIMRGVGDDEWRVHALLNPEVPVVKNPDRRDGVREAASQGADLAVLDDAFQHRRAARDADVVLVSADRWGGTPRLLPAGPFREPLRALRRASLVVVTVKDPHRAPVQQTRAAVEQAAPGVPVVVVELRRGGLRRVSAGDGAVSAEEPMEEPVEALRDATVLAVSAIGHPEPFERVIADHARACTVMRFPDHHPFRAADVQRILHASEGAQRVVCTLKDAVKLAPLWPASAIPLWYLSQTVVVRENARALQALLDRLLAVRGVR